MDWIEREVLEQRAQIGKTVDFPDFEMKSDLPGLPIAAVGFWGLVIAAFGSHFFSDWFEAMGWRIWAPLWASLIIGFLLHWQNTRARRDAYAVYLCGFTDEQLEGVADQRFRYPSVLSKESIDAAVKELEARKKG